MALLKEWYKYRACAICATIKIEWFMMELVWWISLFLAIEIYFLRESIIQWERTYSLFIYSCLAYFISGKVSKIMRNCMKVLCKK